jgi:uncharacterized membrane protein
MVNRLDAGGDIDTFVIQPNRSMSWRALITAYGVVASTTMIVGAACYVAGMPLVLPFSGLEVMVLGIALYLNAWCGGVKEVITISDSALAVEQGRTAPETRHEFQRPWAKVILERPGNSWYPSRLLIRSHGRQVEVGRFLNEQERQGLAQQLRMTLRYCAPAA